MKRNLRSIASLALILLLVGAGIAFYFYQTYFNSPNVPDYLENPYIQIPTNSTFEEVVDLLKEEGFIKDEQSFKWFSDYMKYKKDPMRAGRFEIKPGWSNIQLIRQLRNGAQAPVKVVINGARLPEDIVEKVSASFEFGAADLAALFRDTLYLKTLGYQPETLMSLFIPNTYEMYWNSSPKSFLERMAKEHDAFWSKNDRLEKAKNRGMSPEEVYTLASIVERETQNNGEKPRMAGVYLNRLAEGILLQADPTAVFARRDFDARRVWDYHTKFDSPYNTYMYKGLPPGPISMASIASIDAVLNAEDHRYIFFCAKGDGSGTHNFAETLAAHNQNARIYRRNLKKRGKR